ncbi:hypothetical protein JOM56_000138 [Amanita muscaria]
MLSLRDAMMSPASAVSLHIGNLINWFLWGVLSTCTTWPFPNDRTVYKLVVYVVYFVESVHAIGLAAGLSIMMVSMANDGMNDDDGWVNITIILLTLCGGLVMSLITQCLYAFRIRAITEMLIIPGIIAAATLVVDRSVRNQRHTLIAVVMVRALSSHHSPSYHTEWKTMRLMRLIVETGCATATVNLASLLLVAVSAYIGDVFSAPLIILSKVYANSIMVLLNNRISIVGSRNVPAPMKSVDFSRQTDSTTQSQTQPLR